MNEGPIERVRLLLERSAGPLATGDVAAALCIPTASARRALARLVRGGEASKEGEGPARRYRRAELRHVEPVGALAQRALAALIVAPRTLAKLAIELGATIARTRAALIVLKRQGTAAPERRGKAPRWKAAGPPGDGQNPAGPKVGKVGTTL